MRNKVITIAIALLLTSCATFKPRHLQYIEPAIEIQSSALTNPLFNDIMSKLNQDGDVIWDDRLNASALKETNANGNKMDWFLRKYEESGGLEVSKLKAWRKWFFPWSPTTAKINRNRIYLNLFKFNEDEFALANTFVHEKNHYFGLVHDSSQTRISNHCDAGYLAGDLAEAILRSKAGNKDRTPHAPVCPALCTALEAKGLWSACEANSQKSN